MTRRLLRRAAGPVFVLLFPLALFLGNLHWVVMDQGTYEVGMVRYGALAAAGQSERELSEAAKQIIAYWNDNGPINKVSG